MLKLWEEHDLEREKCFVHIHTLFIRLERILRLKFAQTNKYMSRLKILVNSMLWLLSKWNRLRISESIKSWKFFCLTVLNFSQFSIACPTLANNLRSQPLCILCLYNYQKTDIIWEFYLVLTFLMPLSSLYKSYSFLILTYINFYLLTT